MSACAPIEDSDQPVHLRNLVRLFAGHSLGYPEFKASTRGQRRRLDAHLFSLFFLGGRKNNSVQAIYLNYILIYTRPSYATDLHVVKAELVIGIIGAIPDQPAQSD